MKRLINKIVIFESSNTHVLSVKTKANPEVPILNSYNCGTPISFWDSFPENNLPKKIETKINTKVLEEKIEKANGKMLPHQFAKAQNALSFSWYGAPRIQKISLPGCKVYNTTSTAEYEVDITDTIASLLKKGFVSGPFSEPPLAKFRVKCQMATRVRKSDQSGTFRFLKTVLLTTISTSMNLRKLKDARQNLSATQSRRPEKRRENV
jgi:hypothetical protein